MATDFTGNIRNKWSTSDTLVRLIIVNVAIYLGIVLTKAITGLFMVTLEDYFDASKWLAVPAAIPVLITKPWTLLTYMFFHEDFFHILFNMLWLYWLGRILQEYLGNKKLLSTYILGGLCGAALFILAYNVFPLFQATLPIASALGASAGVLAVTVAAATHVPDYRVALFGILVIPLKYIAVVTILFDFINISGDNAGGHVAHIGGALFGFIYVRRLKKGKDLAGWFHRLSDRIVVFFSGTRMKVSYKRPARDEDFLNVKKAQQEKVDEILDKISKSGYGSLSKEEKDFLFKSSKDN